MPESPGVAPLRWEALVGEALRRRRDERLTQRDHAALAGVSVPTLAAFDRGETSLSLGKAFDILRVVGLLAEGREEGAQDGFVRAALDRWRTLTDGLPETSPARFPQGWFSFDYHLAGDLKVVDLPSFEALLKKAVRPMTGWPVFMVLDQKRLAPREVDGALEYWLSPEGGPHGILNDAAHCDYWRASPAGRFFVLRGYGEDGQETFPPGTVMDTTLPTWRLAEALLHAARMATALGRHRGADRPAVHFRATYTGMSGRVLRAWANPFSDLVLEGHAARSDEAVLEAVLTPGDIEGRLADCVHPLVASLYERFGVTGLSPGRVASEIERMTRGRGARAPA